ncbi:gp272 [Bacillus phage G]|uniref:Gp272 n=1 Tax=Bacillus phage G TaxID=2884420 RepID=G3MA13_9CAUD|nr:gp272 [Bacillus phage G]AEO93531.1 gp272 [Bacillus phage G]
METRVFELAEEVYFCEINGVHKGYIEKLEENIINVLVDDSKQEKGYRVWRVEEFFIAKNPKEAEARWNDYRSRLSKYKDLINMKRKENKFHKGLSVIVEPFDKQSYKGLILLIGKAALVLATEDGRLMRVDKCICTPTDEVIHFKKEIVNE